MRRWKDDIVDALSNLGGQASLAEIYGEVRRLRAHLTQHWKAIVRNVIESHSSDSENWNPKRPDLFYSVHGKGAGVWGLR